MSTEMINKDDLLKFKCMVDGSTEALIKIRESVIDENKRTYTQMIEENKQLINRINKTITEG